MPITSEKVLRKMNEIQSKGGPSIGHWHILRRWLLEDEQVQENFFDAVENDPDMTPEQKEYWLAQKPANTGLQADGAKAPAEMHLCGNCGVPRFVHGVVLEACPNCGDDETDLSLIDDVP